MTKYEYIKTLYVNNIKVDLGIDDYGQCYFIEYMQNGELREVSLGTYNSNYMEEIYGLLDPVYHSLRWKERTGRRMSQQEILDLYRYEEMFDKEYKGA